MIRKFEIRNSKLETNPKFEIRILFCALALVLGLDAAFAQPRRLEQPPPLSPAEGAREAKALVAEMLAERPEQNSTNVGILKIRDGEGNQRQIPLKIVTLITRTNWLQIYETSPAPSSPAITLTIIHTSQNTNQYLLSSSANSSPKLLTPAELMSPFAGSDFWIADLGYEFLHWPKQIVIKNDMRHSRACKVLESTNPNPTSGGYSRVVCWITVEKPHAPVHADAYDASGRFKQFDPKNLEKVNGVYQIESVEMRNARSGSHTVLEFDTQ
jgi:Outer membrane lipoprotein-sorting protein